jgi:hypothetical protein
MTAAEAAEADEKLTKGLGEAGAEGGPLTRRRELLRLLDEVSANYILTIAESTHKTPAQVVGDMVRERIAATA